DGARFYFRRPFHGDTAREDRESQLLQACHVPYRSVAYQARDAPFHRGDGEDLTKAAALEMTAHAHHENGTGPAKRERLVNREVVARGARDRDRCTAQARRRIHRPHVVHHGTPLTLCFV